MKTLLEKESLSTLLNKPVLFDANIFMIGIENRISDKNCSFETVVPDTVKRILNILQNYFKLTVENLV